MLSGIFSVETTCTCVLIKDSCLMQSLVMVRHSMKYFFIDKIFQWWIPMLQRTWTNLQALPYMVHTYIIHVPQSHGQIQAGNHKF